ncbi:hypothetical protein Bca4012_070597 [Brassica carinata]
MLTDLVPFVPVSFSGSQRLSITRTKRVVALRSCGCALPARAVTRRAKHGAAAAYHPVFLCRSLAYEVVVRVGGCLGSLHRVVLGRANHKERIIGETKITGF